LSREERAAAYEAARKRIFGDSEKAGDATPGKSIITRMYCILTHIKII
jgi:hypothetical protein